MSTEWDGVARPPVGVTCEYLLGGENEWMVVTVIAISERPGGQFTDYWLRNERGKNVVVGNPYRFRPIRNEAERRRESQVEAISQVLEYRDGCSAKPLAGWIIDAIAAGKIPGVKLEDS
ncbi:hypothetical protein [Pantoea sp. BAV 3049]|uniref:hypothetical protein n=1 Tax=Pantoea sp. BAV 3049 TaxID=2654188 RepID=UPI00131E7E88|nr:hypothetical protein [Pantoea sp. BAV 3049]